MKNYGLFALLCVASLHAAKQDVVQFCPDKKAVETVFEMAKKDNKLVIIDFFAEWCGPCKMMAPVFERLAGDMKDTCIFAKIDVDQCKASAKEFKIQAMPTIVITRDGKELGRLVGSKTYAALKQEIEALIK